MKIAAVNAIAAAIPTDELSPKYIIPSVFDRSVAANVAKAVAQAAVEAGVAGKPRG
jgi:malate dehydrogenase (oxaloacetate-decarboxylating)